MKTSTLNRRCLVIVHYQPRRFAFKLVFETLRHGSLNLKPKEKHRRLRTSVLNAQTTSVTVYENLGLPSPAFEGLRAYGLRCFGYMLMPQAVLLSALLKKLRAPSYFRTQQRAPPRSQFPEINHAVHSLLKGKLSTFSSPLSQGATTCTAESSWDELWH